MIKTVYIIRHANKYNCLEEYIEKHDKVRPLSYNGIMTAFTISNNPNFSNIDTIYSSEYSRAWQTVAILSEKLNIPINISKAFNERKRSTEIPKDYRLNQLKDENYKIGNGESSIQVFNRFNNKLNKIINSNSKNIIISSHKNAIIMYLRKLCDYTIDDNIKLFFNNKQIFNGDWDNMYPVFKIQFDDNKIIDISSFYM